MDGQMDGWMVCVCVLLLIDLIAMKECQINSKIFQ